MIYSAILNMVTMKWEIGRIIDHCAIPLDRAEIEQACLKLTAAEEIPQLVEERHNNRTKLAVLEIEIIAWREMASYYLDSESTTHQCDLMAKKLLGRTAADYAGKTVVDSAEMAKLRAAGKAAAVLSHLIDLHEFPLNAQHLIDRIKEETAPFLGNGLLDPPNVEVATLKAELAKLKREADHCDHNHTDIGQVIKLRNALEVIRSELGKIHVEEPISRAYSTAHTALTDLYVTAAKMTESTRAADPSELEELRKDLARAKWKIERMRGSDNYRAVLFYLEMDDQQVDAGIAGELIPRPLKVPDLEKLAKRMLLWEGMKSTQKMNEIAEWLASCGDQKTNTETIQNSAPRYNYCPICGISDPFAICPISGKSRCSRKAGLISSSSSPEASL